MGESAVGKGEKKIGAWCWFLLLQGTCYSARLILRGFVDESNVFFDCFPVV